jgi:hypothetical protein
MCSQLAMSSTLVFKGCSSATAALPVGVSFGAGGVGRPSPWPSVRCSTLGAQPFSMEVEAAFARAEPLTTAATAQARAERRTASTTALLRVKRGLVVHAEVLLLRMKRFVFVIAHERLTGLARVKKVQMKALCSS